MPVTITSAEPVVQVIHVDNRRMLIRLPTLLCPALSIAACLVTVGALAAGRGDVAQGCTPVIVVPLILFGLVRWTVLTTRLCLDADGLEFHVRGSQWAAPWTALRSVIVRTPWEGTHPGGYSAGVRLTLVDGTVRDIPDTLQVGRNELAAIIQARQRRCSTPGPPGG